MTDSDPLAADIEQAKQDAELVLGFAALFMAAHTVKNGLPTPASRPKVVEASYDLACLLMDKHREGS